MEEASGSNEVARSTRVLLVEDNPIDARVARKAIASLGIDCVVDLAEDGDAAIDHLVTAAASVVGLPDLVLLDLNLPGRDGMDVLEHVKADPALRQTPIVVVTTSANDADVVGAYDRGANAYVNKPSDLDGWRRLMHAITSFWFDVVRLPGS